MSAALDRGAATGSEKDEVARDGRLWDLIEAGQFLAEELHLHAVLQRIVETACRVIGARYGALGVINEDRTGLSDFIFHGLTAEDRRRIGSLPVGKGLLGALIDDPKPIRLADLTSDQRSVGFPKHHPAMRSFLGVPIRSKRRVFGNLYLTQKMGDGEFSEEDERLAVALAAQAGVAIENARLYESARSAEVEAGRRLAELETVHELALALLGELDPPRVLRTIAVRARELVRADTALVLMREQESREFRVRVATGVRAGVAEGMTIPIEGSFSGLVAETLEPVLIDDCFSDERAYSPVAQELSARSAIFAPLAERGQGIGTLAVVHQDRGHFKPADLSVVASFASLASVALRNARLVAAERERAEMEGELAETRVRAELQDETLRSVIRAQEEERRRVARELHDSAGQALASILLGLKVVGQERTLPEVRGRLADLREITADAAAEVRRIALELRPSALDDLGLEAALSRYAKDVEDRTGLAVALEVELAGRLGAEVETVVYRVAQEAVTNTVKYAGAKAVQVNLKEHDGVVRLSVVDDGSGFDLSSAARTGLGLRGMRERADLVGGRLAIDSAPGRGTTVVLEVPLGSAD